MLGRLLLALPVPYLQHVPATGQLLSLQYFSRAILSSGWSCAESSTVAEAQVDLDIIFLIVRIHCSVRYTLGAAVRCPRWC